MLANITRQLNTLPLVAGLLIRCANNQPFIAALCVTINMDNKLTLDSFIQLFLNMTPCQITLVILGFSCWFIGPTVLNRYHKKRVKEEYDEPEVYEFPFKNYNSFEKVIFTVIFLFSFALLIASVNCGG